MYAILSTLIDLNSIPQAASSLEQAILTFQRWQEGGGFEGEGERITLAVKTAAQKWQQQQTVINPL